MNELTPALGFAAAALTTIAFVPQVIKVWRTGSAASISFGMHALFTLGVGLWMVYGILTESWLIIIANCLTLLLAGALLVMKITFGSSGSHYSRHPAVRREHLSSHRVEAPAWSAYPGIPETFLI